MADCNSELALGNEFDQFFQNRISKIQRAIGPSEPPPMQHRDGSQLQCFSRLSEEKSKFASKLVSASKTASCSLDPLPNRLLKEHLDDILPLLTHLINVSLSESTFPDVWKSAVVIPLLK